MTIGDRLKKCFSEKGFTQETAAMEIGISQSAISELTNGKREMRSGSLKKICECLGVSADYILGLSSVVAVNADKDEAYKQGYEDGVRQMVGDITRFLALEIGDATDGKK